MSLPDFFIIGAAKAGTTSLFALLERHPDIFMSTPKEPEFFARDDLYSKGLESYADLFEQALPGQTLGEASTIYSHAPFFGETAGRIAQHVPQARFVYVMREPVGRAYSYYTQIVKNYQNGTKDYSVNRSFEEFVIPERHATAAPRDKVFAPFNAHLPDSPELCLAGSDYVLQIEAYLAHFPPERFLFLLFEDFREDRVGTLRKITDFLGLAPLPDDVFADNSTTRNVSRKYFDQAGSTARVVGLKRKFGPLWALKSLFPKRLRSALRKGVAKGGGGAHQPPPMAPATRQMLAARFNAQRPRLRELTGLTFETWDKG